MEAQLFELAVSSSYLILAALLAGALFFAMVALRDLGDGHVESLLYSALSAFFGAAHVYYLLNLPHESVLAQFLPVISIWSWLALIAAPVLTTMFLLLALFSFAAARARAGMVKLFFGLTLLCFVFMLGQEWPTDVRAVITLAYALMWFNVEVATTD